MSTSIGDPGDYQAFTVREPVGVVAQIIPWNFPQIGPLVSDAQLARVSRYLDEGKAAGATLHAGGHRYGTRGYFVAPTVFGNASPAMSIIREEIFGPVLGVMSYAARDLGAVAALANDTT